MSPIRIG